MFFWGFEKAHHADDLCMYTSSLFIISTRERGTIERSNSTSIIIVSNDLLTWTRFDGRFHYVLYELNSDKHLHIRSFWTHQCTKNEFLDANLCQSWHLWKNVLYVLNCNFFECISTNMNVKSSCSVCWLTDIFPRLFSPVTIPSRSSLLRFYTVRVDCLFYALREQFHLKQSLRR